MRVRGKKLSRRHIRLIVSLVLLVTIIGLIALIIRNMNAPAVGSLNQEPPKQDEVIDPYKEPGTLSGKYISFTYPAHYKQKPVKLTGSYLEVLNFISTDHSSKEISVGVVKEQLEDDSGIAFRRAHPENYTEEPRTRNGLIFKSKTGNAERTAFIQNGDYVASISVTAPAGTNILEDSQTVISSLRWK